jgi:hypothetical protein
VDKISFFFFQIPFYFAACTLLKMLNILFESAADLKFDVKSDLYFFFMEKDL